MIRTRRILATICLLAGAVVAVGDTQVNAEADETTTRKPGAVKVVDLGNDVKLELVWVPPGEFDMGSERGHPSERPVHRVRISKGFWMGKYEITQAQWKRFDVRLPAVPHGGANLPVDRVNRASCIELAKQMTERHGKTAGGRFRLPTEAEWEYACRAGTKTRYYTGDTEEDLDRAGWTRRNSPKPHPGGELAPNAWGLYDMHGNFWEWCLDGKRVYTEAAVTDPRGPEPTIPNRKKAKRAPLPTQLALDEDPGGPPLEEEAPLPEPIPTVLRGGWYIRSAERSRSASRWLLPGGGYGGGRSMRVVLEPK